MSIRVTPALPSLAAAMISLTAALVLAQGQTAQPADHPGSSVVVSDATVVNAAPALPGWIIRTDDGNWIIRTDNETQSVSSAL